MDNETIETYNRALTRVAEVYHCTLAEYGPTTSGVAWGDTEGQFRKFEILASGINREAPLLLNDVGCGYGALFDFLAPNFDLVGYCGTDICEAMVEAGLARINDPRARFVQSAMPITPADWSIASGTFNMSAGADDEVWRRLVEDVLRSMVRLSGTGIAFNLLRPEYRDDFLWGDAPERWVRFCQD